MELSYQTGQQQTRLVYGETLNRGIPKEFAAGQHVIIVTNQKYYDRSFEKISQLFAGAMDVDWYICRNQMYCNNLTELADLLAFLERFPRDRRYLLVSYGNEGATDLTGFIQQTTVLNSRFCCLPVSIRSLAKGLTSSCQLVGKDLRPLLSVDNLPRDIFFDQTITEEQGDGKLVDFLILLRAGLVSDNLFLKDLYRNFTTRQTIFSRSFVTYIQQLAEFYREKQREIEAYGKLFELAFYELPEGHLLSANMKRMMGILFQLIWNDQRQPLDLDLPKFFHWLKALGFPLNLPKQVALTEYNLQVIKLMKDLPPLDMYQQIGIKQQALYPSSEELIRMTAVYQQLIGE